MSSHYDAAYFAWQETMDDFGGWANASAFSDEISESDLVLDFGCGGGGLLTNIRCAERFGIEINPAARAKALSRGIRAFAKSSDVPDHHFDKIISNHALEHALHPLTELVALHHKLRPDGKAIFVVPCENISYGYAPGDINRHLYSWSPMCIGNLFDEAGFRVISAEAHWHKWPPFYKAIAKLGRPAFNLASSAWAHIDRRLFQVKIVAAHQ